MTFVELHSQTLMAVILVILPVIGLKWVSFFKVTFGSKLLIIKTCNLLIKYLARKLKWRPKYVASK